MSESARKSKGTRVSVECEGGVRVAALAKEYFGVEHCFELLLDQPRLGGAGLLVVAEEARKFLRAVAMASPHSLDLIGFEHSKKRGNPIGSIRGQLWSLSVAFGHLVLEARGKT